MGRFASFSRVAQPWYPRLRKRGRMGRTGMAVIHGGARVGRPPATGSNGAVRQWSVLADCPDPGFALVRLQTRPHPGVR
jgi:hypothetical protein